MSLTFRQTITRYSACLSSLFEVWRVPCRCVSVLSPTSDAGRHGAINENLSTADDETCWTPLSRRTGCIGLKLGMQPMWKKDGQRVVVTLIKVQNCQVVQVKTKERDGFTALQLGAVNHSNSKRVAKPLQGHFAKAGVPAKCKLWDFKVTEDALLPVGTQIIAAHFRPGQYVDVTGITIGKGFQGVMKRHKMKGQRASHGVTKTHRKMGATGGGKDPGRIWPGKRMPGRMGCKVQTTRSLKVYRINNKYNILYVGGCIPGHDGNYVRVTDAQRKQLTAPPPFPTFHCMPYDQPEEEYADEVMQPCNKMQLEP